MPRFPVHPQRTSAPAAFSNTPRAQAAHFGAGIGRNLAKFGSEAANLGQVIEQREDRQLKQELSHLDIEVARQRAASDAQAPPEENSESRVKRHQSIFDTSADTVLQSYEGQGLQGRLGEGIAARREALNQKLLGGEAQRRLQKTLSDTQALAQQWSERVAQDPSEFSTASRELLGDEATGETGLLAGLGLRPEALAAWRGHTLNQLLDAQMKNDPAGLIAELEAGRWQELLPEDRRNRLLEDTQEALARQRSANEIERTQGRAGKALELFQEIGAGKVGQAEVRRAEETGALSAPQAEALHAEAARAEIALQAQQIASDELTLSLSSGVGFDMENPQNRQAADAFYETTYSQAIREGTSDASQAQVVSMVAKTGYLPPRLVRDTTGLLHGNGSARRIAGAELYGGLRDAVPSLANLVFDPEIRARGGILKRWLDMGLEPADALQRAAAEWPRDGSIQILDADEMEVLKRDLGSLLTGTHSGHHVDRILAQLEQNYLDDLGKGLTPRHARQQLGRDVGRVMRRLTLLRDSAGDEPDSLDDGRSPFLVSVNAKRNPGNQALRGSGGKGGTKPKEWWLGPSGNPLDDELANAAGLELGRMFGDFADWMVESYIALKTMRREFDARTFPDSAALRSKDAMVSIGDGEDYLSKIVEEDRDNGTRSVTFKYPGLGVLIVRQHYRSSRQRFENLDVTFEDPETGEEITEKLPSSRFYVSSNFVGEVGEADSGVGIPDIISPDETTATGDHARVTPPDQHRPTVLPGRPSEPIPVIQLPLSEPGPGRELTPNNTGGNQTDIGPLTELAPGFPAHEQEPQIYISPDEREELRKYQILLQANVSADGPGLPAGLTEVDLEPANPDANPRVNSVPGQLWTPQKSRTVVQNAWKHYSDHRKEFPEINNVKEYVEKTHKFVNNPPSGVLAKKRENGDILLYDPSTNTFAVRDVNGVPRTMFRPVDKMDYWNDQ